jgi:hypothetical protein
VVGAAFLLLKFCDERAGESIDEPGQPGPSRLHGVPRGEPSIGPVTGTSTDVAVPLASSDVEFIARLRRVDARRLLADTPSSDEVLDLVASARIPEAVERSK